MSEDDESDINESYSRYNNSKRSKRCCNKEKYDIMPPDYSVEEDRFGRLVNQEKRLVWPSKIPLNPSDFATFLITPPLRKKAEKEYDKVRLTDCEKSFSQMTTITAKEEININPQDAAESVFIGGATPQEAAKKIGSSCFVLYYRLNDEVEISLPLYMAYKSSKNKIFHFRMIRVKRSMKDKSVSVFWRVDYGDPTADEFNSLANLVRHYRVFSYFDKKTGTWETFPIGKNHIVDSYE